MIFRIYLSTICMDNDCFFTNFEIKLMVIGSKMLAGFATICITSSYITFKTLPKVAEHIDTQISELLDLCDISEDNVATKQQTTRSCHGKRCNQWYDETGDDNQYEECRHHSARQKVRPI